MCLLIQHTKDSIITLEMITDFYTKNPDGFGAVIRNQNQSPTVIKTLAGPKGIDEIYTKNILGHDALLHFRWKTHGDVSIDNVHPYEVVPSVWMMHNGVLHTGNSRDTKMSDTWHYIEDFIKPFLRRAPDLLHEPAFLKMLESHIGRGNKFAFMDSKGEIIIANKSEGVEHDGMWFSNTYAWTPEKFGYKSKYQYTTGYSYNGYTSYPATESTKAITTSGNVVTTSSYAGKTGGKQKELFVNKTLTRKERRSLYHKMNKPAKKYPWTNISKWEFNAIVNQVIAIYKRSDNESRLSGFKAYIKYKPEAVKALFHRVWTYDPDINDQIVDEAADYTVDLLLEAVEDYGTTLYEMY